MADKQAGVYASAISVLKRAIELDSANRLEEAVVCYQEGLQLLIDYLKGNKKHKNPKRLDTRKTIAVIILKHEQCGFAME